METMPYLTALVNRPAMWKPVAICGAIGGLGSRITGKRNVSRTAVGCAIGALVGLGATAAWTSRRFVDARDRHWLATHPIDYA